MLSALVSSFRPRQWVKNAVALAPLIFAVRFLDPAAVERALIAVLLLCLLSSAVYLMNDCRDASFDRLHPSKKHRPIASGALPPSVAYLATAVLVLLGLGLASALSPLAFSAALGFLLVNGLYSFGGKQVAIVDVMLIGGSFCARVLVGAAAVAVPASAWLLLTLFFLASYLGFTKRAAEYRLEKPARRSALSGYSPAFLDHARSATLSVTLALYTLYTFSSPFGAGMAATVPFVFLGLMRYQAIADADDGKNDGPSDHLYEDPVLLSAVVLWGLSAVAVIFVTRHL